MGFQNSLNKKNYIHQEVYSQNFQKQSLEDQGWHMAAEVFSGIFAQTMKLLSKEQIAAI